MKNKKLIHISGFDSSISFENKDLFNRFPEDSNARKIFLFHKIKMPNNYEIINVIKDNDGNETWVLEKCKTEINIQDYPFDLKFYICNKFQNTANDDELRNNLLIEKVGPNYRIENVVKRGSGEVWWLTSDDKEHFYSKKLYKITIRDYPCTFNFDVRRKFKPFTQDDDDGRSFLLLSKMYEKRIKTKGHTYEDYVIENVECWENSQYGESGEIWTLGS